MAGSTRDERGAGGMDVAWVSHLARLSLSREEQEHLGSQLGDVLAYVEKLKELEVDQVEPMLHAVPRVNVTRPDTAGESLPAEPALGNAPARANDLFLVPKIIE